LNEIKKADPETITLVGAEANEAILFTAADLRNYGYKVIVPLDKIIAKDDYLQNIGITLMADVFGVTLV
jgi:nicotinamidase-related amidase